MSVPGTPPTPERVDSAAAEAVSEPATPPEGASAREHEASDRDVLSAVLVPLIPAVHETLESDEEIAEALALAIVRAGFRRVAEGPAPNTYRIEVTIPLGLPDALRERLFESVADVVHDWEPDDREGWDAFVSGHAIYDELTEELP